MKVQSKAIAALLVCSALWSTGGIFIKTVSWHPLALAGARSFLGGVVILLFLKRPKLHFSFPQVAAALCNTGTMLLFVSSTKLTTAANAILLQYSAPIFVALLGWFLLKEKPRSEHWFALVFITVGISLFFVDKVEAGNLLGNVLAAVSGLTFALYAVFMRMQKEGSAVESVLLSHCLTFAVGLPFMLMNPPGFGAAGWGALLFLGVFQIGLSSFLFSHGIKHVPAVQAMLIAVLEPILNPLWVFLFIGEIPSFKAVAGGLVIIFAVSFSSFVSLRRNGTEENRAAGGSENGKNKASVSHGLSESDPAKDPASAGLP